MLCLFCDKELSSAKKRFCNNSCKGYYHRYISDYPEGFSPEIAKYLRGRSKRGRKLKAPEDRLCPINIPIHDEDYNVVSHIQNFKSYLLEELNIFLLCETHQIANIIEMKNQIILNRSKKYHNYTLYIPRSLLNELDSFANKLLRTRRNLLTIFSLYCLTRN